MVAPEGLNHAVHYALVLFKGEIIGQQPIALKLPRRGLDHDRRLKRIAAFKAVIIVLPDGSNADDILSPPPLEVSSINGDVNASAEPVQILKLSEMLEERTVSDACQQLILALWDIIESLEGESEGIRV